LIDTKLHFFENKYPLTSKISCIFAIRFFNLQILKVFRSIDEVCDIQASVVSTGTFDGVHFGHKAIIARMKEISKENNLLSVIATFDPHPRIALNKDVARLSLLSTLDEKLLLFEKLGIDVTVVIPFTVEFAATPYTAYISRFLVERLHARNVVLGYNHHFGEARSGNYHALADLGGVHHYAVTEVEPQLCEGHSVSSSYIRNVINDGDLELAAKLLGYPYFISGEVVHGNHRGTSMGYPTANILVEDSYKLIPPKGVYAVKFRLKNQEYLGMCSIGTNPTFNDPNQSIEVNIFDFAEVIYGERVEVIFCKYLRPEEKYASVENLVAQLHSDKENTLSFFKNNI
jgi:riboflavin kinase/FMN adenylyltransferase